MPLNHCAAKIAQKITLSRDLFYRYFCDFDVCTEDDSRVLVGCNRPRIETLLAPRKKLWSTPDAAVDAAIKLLSPSKEDVVYDIGCGDARFLVTCAQQNGCRCIGIEIDEDRAKEANAKVVEAGGARMRLYSGLWALFTTLCTHCTHCLTGVSHLVTIRVGNALEMDFSDATGTAIYLLLLESVQCSRLLSD
jgi:SAM-dependent methyltransferase